ncbi:MAG: lysylphosphatidylglycerol synthase transmembrane domain-containing protein [Bacteroidetes bacterium]|nr:lysylphosphatidylglycerol synthase transmembrane domain-containing protein [Bacteroidota bacterium]
MKKLVFSILQYLLFLSIGLGLLWLVFRKIDKDSIMEELKTINYFWIIMLFISGLISHLSRAVRWNLMIGSLNYKTSTIRTFYAVMVGYLANLAIPRLGEVTRCGILAKTDKIPVNSLIGTVIAERIFDMIVLLVITLLVILFQLNLVGGFVHKYLVMPFLTKFSGKFPVMVFFMILVIVIALLVLLFRKLLPLIRHLAIYQKIATIISGFVSGMMTIQRMKHKGRFLFWTLMIWGNYFLMTYLCFFSMKATSHLTVIDGFTLLSLGSFGFVAPVPGGIGAYHFIVKAILVELYGLSPVAAASYATISHTAQTLLLLVAGAVSYLLVFLYLKKVKNGQTGKNP